MLLLPHGQQLKQNQFRDREGVEPVMMIRERGKTCESTNVQLRKKEDPTGEAVAGEQLLLEEVVEGLLSEGEGEVKLLLRVPESLAELPGQLRSTGSIAHT